MPLFIRDAHSTTIHRRFRSQAPQVGISPFGAAEFGAAMSTRLRTREFTPEQAARVLATFDAWTTAHADIFEVEPADHRVAAGFVRRFDLGLRAPDALHIAICRRLRLPLLTFDARQAVAAASLGVACDPAGATAAAAVRPGPA